ncbi:unnamed protein product [Sphacelaria rigidula]
MQRHETYPVLNAVQLHHGQNCTNRPAAEPCDPTLVCSSPQYAQIGQFWKTREVVVWNANAEFTVGPARSTVHVRFSSTCVHAILAWLRLMRLLCSDISLCLCFNDLQHTAHSLFSPQIQTPRFYRSLHVL